MKITRVQAHPISFRVPEGQHVRLGIGRAVKRDAVLVKVDTDEGISGWGAAHHGRAPGAVAKLVDTTLRELVPGMDALGCVRPLEAPGIGIEVDEDFIAAHPLIDGPCYV